MFADINCSNFYLISDISSADSLTRWKLHHSNDIFSSYWRVAYYSTSSDVKDQREAFHAHTFDTPLFQKWHFRYKIKCQFHKKIFLRLKPPIVIRVLKNIQPHFKSSPDNTMDASPKQFSPIPIRTIAQSKTKTQNLTSKYWNHISL